MDDSSKVAAWVPGVVLVVSWAISSLYLFFYEKRHGVRTENKFYYSWTFHVESLRFYGFINFVIMLFIGAMITSYSGLDTIQDPHETVIFELFGINHSCNWVDHNPARMIAAILCVPFVQLPLMAYVIIWHCRLRKEYKMGKAPRWLYYTSRFFTPFNLITMAELHLWFVNNPDDTYGFTGHYIPYLMFQISCCLLQMMNICYLTTKGDLPWGVPRWLAWSYFTFFTALTVFYIVFVLSTLAGAPVVSAPRSGPEYIITKILSVLWAAMALLGTLVFSGKERLNGDTITLDLGDDMLSMKLSGDDDTDKTATATATSAVKVDRTVEELSDSEEENEPDFGKSIELAV